MGEAQCSVCHPFFGEMPRGWVVSSEVGGMM